MTVLSGLELVTSKKSIKANPIVHRRNKLVAKIHEQLELCQAKMNGQLYAPKKLRTYVNKQTGQRITVEAVKRIKEWKQRRKVFGDVKIPNRRLSFKLAPRTEQKLEAVLSRTGWNKTSLVRGVVMMVEKDIIENRSPKRVLELQDIAAAVNA